MDLKEVKAMAKTPYSDLGSQDILSAHISGLQHDINKIQEILNMKTAKVTNHTLNPIADQDDPSLRYRIYEGSIRNWLKSPAPIIYRDGVQVNKNEYEIQEAYGVVVFHAQQRAQDRISADFTHIINESIAMEEKASQSDLMSLQQDVSNLDQRVEVLEQSGGGGTLQIDGLYPYYPNSGSYFTHFRRDYHPIKSDENAYNPNTHIPAWNILVYGNTIDAFPLPVERKMRFNKAGIMVGDSSGSSAKCRIGIYKDDNFRPGNLLFQSPEITAAVGTWGVKDIDWELDAGFYWLAVHHGNSANYNGLDERSVLQIVQFDAVQFLKNLAERPNPHTAYGGYRATSISYSAGMPSVFPESGALFKRTAYISPWLVIA